MTTFAEAVSNEMTVTENGMSARVTTASNVLDFFGKVGSSRGVPLVREFSAALAENEELAIRALLWTRDARGGAGERKQFRDLLQYLEDMNADLAGCLIYKIPQLGRWDDLFAYRNPDNRRRAFEFIAEALDMGDGLCAKWMPRKGPLAVELTKFLRMSPRQYRKYLVNRTNVVEQKMCAKKWDEINFSHVPSLAAARYQRAFKRNAGKHYEAYIRELQKSPAERDPSVKINAGAVFPYDVVKSLQKGLHEVANEQWNALPNYVGDANILPLVDTSASMFQKLSKNLSALDVAVSLGLYLSEKNTGKFKDLFLTFSDVPKFQRVSGNTLKLRFDQMCRTDWQYNTNIEAAFKLILKVAVDNGVPQSEMPGTLLILSDMQFDQATGGKKFNPTAVELVSELYEDAGYKMPKLVFWHLSTRGRDNSPVRFDESGTALVSGFSPAIVRTVLSDDYENFTPYNVMLKTLMSERYSF